ncbi:MAG: FxsA family protein [Halanaerobiaceae bacterium]
MFYKLLLLFVFVPLIELALLISLGGYIGLIPTILVVASTGVVGVSLARTQGLKVINDIKNEFSHGILPQQELIDGLLILVGGTFLLTPGLLTDVTGFMLIIPLTRQLIGKVIRRKMKDYISKNQVNFNTENERYKEDYINIEYEDH